MQDGKEKCAQYWPKAVSASTQFGPFLVTFKASEQCSAYGNLVIIVLDFGPFITCVSGDLPPPPPFPARTACAV